ncbi:MAG: hypothetical protein QXS02_02100, partial [Candidatus Thermoplasmatota archaeon]
ENRLWDRTWGLIVCEEDSPIYALCDWRNITQASRHTPILAICAPSSTPYEIIMELKRLFPRNKTHYKVIFEKKWTVGLHQSNEQLFKIPRRVASALPNGFYLAGDWMVLPALEGAVRSGINASHVLMQDVIET